MTLTFEEFAQKQLADESDLQSRRSSQITLITELGEKYGKALAASNVPGLSADDQIEAIAKLNAVTSARTEAQQELQRISAQIASINQFMTDAANAPEATRAQYEADTATEVRKEKLAASDSEFINETGVDNDSFLLFVADCVADPSAKKLKKLRKGLAELRDIKEG